MRAGLLRKKVKLQKPIRAADIYGGATETWTTVADVWIGIEPMTDQERFFSQQLRPEGIHKVMARYRSDIQQSWRFLYGSRVL